MVKENTKYAGFWPRFLALFIDGFIYWPISFILNTIPFNHISVIFLPVMFSGVDLIYNILMLGFFGQTVGMMVSRIKVKKLDLKKLDGKKLS